MFVGGNEGLAEVTGVGDDVKNLERSDWVVIKASHVGTWRSAANLREGLEGLSEVNAATMMVRVLSQSCLRFQGFRPFRGGLWTRTSHQIGWSLPVNSVSLPLPPY